MLPLQRSRPPGASIDAHVHVWTSDTARYPLAPGVEKKDLWLPSFTPEEHFAYSRSVGAVRLNLVQMIWYGTDHSYILDLIDVMDEPNAGIMINALGLHVQENKPNYLPLASEISKIGYSRCKKWRIIENLEIEGD